MSNSDVLAQALEAYNRDDVDGVVAGADDDVEYVLGARGIRVTGRDQWRALVAAVAVGAPLSWDLGFLAFGAALIVVGGLLHRAGDRENAG